MFDYFSMLANISDYVERFRKGIVKAFFTKSSITKDDLCYTPLYMSYLENINDIVMVCEVLGIETLQNNKEFLLYDVRWLKDRNFASAKFNFEKCLRDLRSKFQEAEHEIKEKLSLLEEEEWLRLNEALNCYMKEFNYSAIVMSVSAVENRLYSLMMSKNPDEKLEKLTLGELINEYLENKEKYGSVISKKHLPLLDYCNVYRILSVHPRKEKITRANATAIMSMTFSFLFDKEQKVSM
jgi:hypothetical protein